MKGHSQLRKGRRSLANQIYHVSSGTLERELVFSNIRYGRVVVNAMRYEHDFGHVESLAFVVMPDHFHWLFVLTGTRQLSICINNVKAYSAKDINRIRGRDGKVWQTGYYERAIRKEEDLEGVARYIVANPLRAGIANSAKDYPLWDAKWL